MKNAPLLAMCDAYGPWHSMCSRLFMVTSIRKSIRNSQKLGNKIKVGKKFKAQKGEKSS